MYLETDDRTDAYVRVCDYVGTAYQSCRVDQYYDSKKKKCYNCSEKFPNCAACDSSDCTMCNENFYYSELKGYDGKSKYMCAPEQCELDYGPNLYTGTCDECTISNCRQCYFDFDSLYSVTEYCRVCDKDYTLSADMLTCTEVTDDSTFY
jgi:hypothetical protein